MSDSIAKHVPRIAQTGPIDVEVVAGETYWWCACGRSQKQPFCDGSHRDSGFSPVAWVCDESKTLSFCACKHTRTPPICDNTHKKL